MPERIKTEIAVIIPTYNEEEAIEKVIEELPKEILGRKVTPIVIDDHSTDKTVEKAKKANALVLMKKGARGKGHSMIQAFKMIDAEVYVTIDGDGTYSGKHLDKLVQPILHNHADKTIAERFKLREEGAISKLNLIGNKIINAFARFVSSYNITDMLSGYRAMSKGCIQSIPLIHTDFATETELTIEAIKRNFRIREISLPYRKRIGKTKLKPIKDGMKIGKTLLWMMRDLSPLKFFGMISLFIVLVALYPASLTIYEKLTFGNVVHLPSTILAAMLFLLATIVFVFGLMADMHKNSMRKLEAIFESKLLKSRN